MGEFVAGGVPRAAAHAIKSEAATIDRLVAGGRFTPASARRHIVRFAKLLARGSR